jgi:hypothetical protein
VDALPQVLAIGHVAVLALSTGPGLGTPLPLAKRVLERLAVHSRIVEELVALGTEAALEVLVAGLEASVWQRIGLRTRVGAPGGSESAVPAPMAARTGEALRAKRGIEVGIGPKRLVEGLL